MKVSNSFQKTVDQDEGRQYRLEDILTRVEAIQDTEGVGLPLELLQALTQQVLGSEESATKRLVELLQFGVQLLQDEAGATKPLVTVTRTIRFMLSMPVENEKVTGELVKAGVVPYLAMAIREDCAELQYEAAWALTNTTATSFTSTVAEHPGVTKHLIELLRSRDAKVREQCAWCLGNIASESAVYCERVLIHEGTIESLLFNIKFPSNDSLLGTVTWAVSTLCQRPTPLKHVRAFVPALCDLALHPFVDGVKKDALLALEYISTKDGGVDAILESDSGIANTLVGIVNDGNPALVDCALRLLGDFVAGNYVQAQAAIDARFLHVAINVLNDPNPLLRKDMLLLLSHIACGTQTQRAELVKTPHLAEAIVKIAIEAEGPIRREAIYAVACVCSFGSDKDVWQLVSLGGLLVVANAVKSCGDDKPLAVLVAKAMTNIARVVNSGMEVE